MSYTVQFIPCKRKTIEIKIKSPDLVVVRYPSWAKKSELEDFLREKSGWIDSNIAKMAARRKEMAGYLDIHKLTLEEIHALADEAMADIPPRVRYFASMLGVDVGSVTIRNQRTRWGSCSSKGNLNFNCMLMQTPEWVRDYVVVHELCHRREMNHSKKFWELVGSVLPDYKRARKWLKDNGEVILSQM